MTVSIYKNMHLFIYLFIYLLLLLFIFFFCKRVALVIKNVRFPLESNLIENKDAYRRWVSNITVFKSDAMENYTKLGV